VASDTMKDRVRRYVALARQKRGLEAEIKLLDEELKPLQAILIDEFLQSGTQHERVDGMTVHLVFTPWARPKDGDQERLCTALVQEGLGDLVHPRVNVQTLSALVRERQREALQSDQDPERIFPPSVMDALDITVDTQLRVTGRGPTGSGPVAPR